MKGSVMNDLNGFAPYEGRFSVGDRVIDHRYGVAATVIYTDYDGPKGCDGYGIVVEYDDDTDSYVSTGTDYFIPAES